MGVIRKVGMSVLLKKLGLGFGLVFVSMLPFFKGFVGPTLYFDLSDCFLCKLFSEDFDEISFWPKRPWFWLVALNKFPGGVPDEPKIEVKSFLAGSGADWKRVLWTPNKPEFIKVFGPYIAFSSFLPYKFIDGICFVDVYSRLVLLTGAKVELFVEKGFVGWLVMFSCFEAAKGLPEGAPNGLGLDVVGFESNEKEPEVVPNGLDKLLIDGKLNGLGWLLLWKGFFVLGSAI